MKTCRVCKQEKPLDAFGVNRHIKGGVNSMCKACGAEATKAYRQANPDYWKHQNDSAAGKARLVRYRQRNKEKLAAAQRERYVANREQILAKAKTDQRGKEVKRQYRLKSRDAINKRISEWQKANRDKCAARTARYRKNNPTAAAETHQRMRAKRPEFVAVKAAKRRVMKMRAQPKWANQFFIKEIYRLAVQRTKATGIKWEVDHIIPLKSPLVCGLHVEHNLQVIPQFDNRSKGNKLTGVAHG